jgi:hypothetical protein
MDKWTDEFGVECNGVEYHKEVTDRTGAVDVTLFSGTKHYPKSGKDIVWHSLFQIEDLDAHCRIDCARATDALAIFAGLVHSENKAIKQLCTDEWGTCGWMTVQEMVAGHIRKTVRLEQTDKVALKVSA